MKMMDWFFINMRKFIEKFIHLHTWEQIYVAYKSDDTVSDEPSAYRYCDVCKSIEKKYINVSTAENPYEDSNFSPYASSVVYKLTPKDVEDVHKLLSTGKDNSLHIIGNCYKFRVNVDNILRRSINL